MLVTIILTFVYLLTSFLGHRNEQKYAANLGLKVRIIRWHPDGETETGIDSNRRIFFHETSGRQYLNLRQTCTVESAAMNNPDRPVQVFMTSDQLDYSGPWLEILQHYVNVNIILIDAKDYFADTPLENWYNDGEWRTSMYKIVHLSDYIRMVTLLKGGGMYMDLDFVTLKQLDEKDLWNFYLIETKEMKLLSNAVLHLERGHRFIHQMIDRLVKYYRVGDYIWHGPSMVSNIMSRNCGVKRGEPNSNNCTDVKLLPHYYFGPISNTEWEKLFEKITPETLEVIVNSYGVHCWSGKSKNEPLDLNSNQLYAVLARQHCPLTVARGQDFLE